MLRLFSELQRRNVFKVAVLYVVVSWLILQVTDVFMGILPLPDWTAHLVFLLLLIGLPLALVLAWAYEVTPEGIKREKQVPREKSIKRDTGRRLNFWIIGTLLIALAYFAWKHDWGGEEALPQVAERSDGPITIAVLPFVNMSEDPSNEYFSDGIAEEILNVLVKVDGLRVTSRTSSFSFKDSDGGLPAIAKALNVDHVLEGSVRKSGDRVRITAQLVDPHTDSHLWSQSYERELEDIFAIQKDISRSIVEALEATLSGGSPAIVDEQVRLTEDVEAYEAYLQGRYQLNNRGQLRADGLSRAIDLFGQAVRLDPNFAEAWAGLGAAHVMYPSYSRTHLEDSTREAERALDQAIALDPASGEAHAALAMLRVLQSRWLEAEQSFRQAVRVDPAFETTYVWYGVMLITVGKIEQARDTLLLGADDDPASGIRASWLADVYRSLGDMERSYAESVRSVELGTVNANLALYFYHQQNEDWESARRTLQQFGDGYGVKGKWPELLISATRDPQATAALEREIGEILEAQPGFYYGWMYFDLADTDLLLDVMDAYAERGDIVSVLFRAWEPNFTELRNHPRFRALMDKINLTEYWRQTGWPDLCQQSTDTLVCD